MSVKTIVNGQVVTLSSGGNFDVSIKDFTGAGISTAGTSGLVPAPSAGDEGKFLRGDGQWVESEPILILGTTSSTVEGAIWLEV